MSLIFTYRYDKQEYVSWKGDIANNQFNLVVPTNKRPNANGTGSGANPQDFIAPVRRPGPIKHWRKQLDPQGQSGRSKASVANLIDRPGGSIRQAQSDDACKNCDASGNSLFAKEYIQTNTPYFPLPNSDDKVDLSNNPKCLACNPESHVIKRATTVLSKNYFSDTNAYLRNRCKTYEQKQLITQDPSNNYFDENGDPAWPDESLNGPQVYNMLNCSNKCGERQTTIYKPNNRPFAKQGATSSSNRLAKLKYDTITRNGASFRSAFGREGANAGKYSTSTYNTPTYFLKNKTQVKCIPMRLSGNKNICESN
jgi:hypothetical protein